MKSPFFIFLWSIISISFLSAQKLHLIHQNGACGLIDVRGNIVVPTVYQYIGKFYRDGYAIVQKNNKLGIVNSLGNISIPCKYEYMRHAGRGLFSVKKEGVWQVITSYDKLLFDSLPGKIEFLDDQFISYQQITGMGLAHLEQGVLQAPVYQNFRLEDDYIIAMKEGLFFILNKKGQLIIKVGAEDYKLEKKWFWIKKNAKWLAYSLEGKFKKNSPNLHFKKIQKNYYSLDNGSNLAYYDILRDTIIAQNKQIYIHLLDNCIKFINTDDTEGVMDSNGRVVIGGEYTDIVLREDGLLDAKKNKKIGVLDISGKVITPFRFEYIGPFSTAAALVRVGKRYGVINRAGKLIVPVSLPMSVTLEENKIRYRDQNNALKILQISEEGEISSVRKYKNVKSLVINALGRRGRPMQPLPTIAPAEVEEPFNSYYKINDTLVWKYHIKAEKWGLWNLKVKKWKYPPAYSGVSVHKKLGFSIVHIAKEKPVGGQMNLGMLNIKFHKVFGLFNNKHGIPITRMEFIDIRLSDFSDKNLTVARVIFKGGKAGLINRIGRLILGDCAYIGEFVEGKARFTRKGYLQVDVEGKEERPITYTANFFAKFASGYQIDQDGNPIYYDPFDNDGRVYCIDGKWGYLDTSGEEIIAQDYDFVENFSNGRAFVKQNNKWGLLEEDGSMLLGAEYDDLNFLPNSEKQLFFISSNKRYYGALDGTGKIAVAVKYSQIRDFKEDRIAVRNLQSRWGFVGKNAQEIISCQYRVVHDFSEGLAVVYHKGLWGAIDKNGAEVIPPTYNHMSSFKEGKSIVSLRNGYKGCIDQKGNLLFKGKYTRLSDFSQGVAAFYISRKGWGLVNTKGEIIMKPKRSILKIGAFNQHGLAKAKVGKKYRLLNKQGEFVGKQSFGLLRAFKEGYAVARIQYLSKRIIGKVNLNFVFIDTFGNIIGKNDFSRLQDFSEGRAAFVGKKSKRGYINTKGEVVIEPQYFRAEPFINNRAIVYKSYSTSGVIDTTGKVIIPLKYKKILSTESGLSLIRQNPWTYFFVWEDAKRHTEQNFHKAYPFYKQTAPIQHRHKWGMVNSQGLQTVTFKYPDMKPFKDRIAKVSVNKLKGVVNISGKVIIEPIYEYIEYVGGGLFRVEKGDAIGYLNQKGDWVRELAE